MINEFVLVIACFSISDCFVVDSCGPSYSVLVGLARKDTCMSANNVWHYLNDLLHRDTHCMHEAINVLDRAFVNVSHHLKTGCECSGRVHNHDFHHVGHSTFSDCSHDRTYMDLKEDLFSRVQRIGCSTHEFLWRELKSISEQNGNDCQKDFIRHAVAIHPRPSDAKDSCTCHNKHDHPTEAPTTSKPPTTIDLHHVCGTDVNYKWLQNLNHAGSSCMSANRVWHYLQLLDDTCRHDIIRKLSHTFQNVHSTDPCTCHGSPTNQHLDNINSGHSKECLNITGYFSLQSKLFNNIRHYGCSNHQFMWNKLNNIHHLNNRFDCQLDLIRRANVRYHDPNNDPCTCQAPVSTSKSVSTATSSGTTTSHKAVLFKSTLPTTIATTSLPSIETTSSMLSTTASSTTTITATDKQCTPADIINGIALSLPFHDERANKCPQGNNNTFDESLLLVSCNMSESIYWKKGVQVMSDCNNIQQYTPVARFYNQGYNSITGQAGVFLGCLPNGFKIAVQPCFGAPEILHIETGVSVHNDPDSYFVIV